MRRYAQVSGVFFALVATAQLTRTVLGLPVRVAEYSVPVWVSGVAFVVTAALAVWGFRSAKAA